MKKAEKKTSSWEWYSVKVLFESRITGEPNKDKVDENYTDQFRTFEERLILVKAKSFEHAYKVAEKRARKEEMEYYNPYDQLVKVIYIEALDCFSLFDEKLVSGTELYSRFIHVPRHVSTDDVVKAYFPEALPADDNDPDYCFVHRIREFNKIPNGEKVDREP